MPPILEAASRLIRQHCFAAKGSVAELAALHRLANMIDGEERSSAWATERLDKMFAAARSKNDAAFFRRYAVVIEMDKNGKTGHQSLTARLLIAWFDFAREHMRAPSQKELEAKLGLMRGGALSQRFTPRHVRRALAPLCEIFEESSEVEAGSAK